jgi:putative SOS response-associated peptidase YedK
MCGRFYIENDIEDIIASYGIKDLKNMAPARGEVYPGTNIPVILKKQIRTLDFFRWGFKVSGINREVINARIETVAEKPSFRRAYSINRCIVPANAFFEWETKEKIKVKYKISVEDKKLFSMAGIYDTFFDARNNPYTGVVILTRPANEDMSKLHHRMPVFVSKENEERWLSKEVPNLTELTEAMEKDSSIKLNIVPADGIYQLSLF